MNIKEFFKRDNLDEMQKQTLLKIESCGFWALWVLLLAALIIESLLGFTPREMAAEWFIFMLGITMVAAPGVPGRVCVGAYQICRVWRGHCGAAGGHHGGLYLGAVLCIAAAQYEGLQKAPR